MTITPTRISANSQLVILLAVALGLVACHHPRRFGGSEALWVGPAVAAPEAVIAPVGTVDELHCEDCTLGEIAARLRAVAEPTGVDVVYHEYDTPLRRDPRDLAFHFFNMTPRDIVRAVCTATGAAWQERRDGTLVLAASPLAWDAPVTRRTPVTPEFFELAQALGRTRDLDAPVLRLVFDRLCLPLPPTVDLRAEQEAGIVEVTGPAACVDDIDDVLASFRLIRRKFHVHAEFWLLADGPDTAFSWSEAAAPIVLAEETVELTSGAPHKWEHRLGDAVSQVDVAVSIAPDQWQLDIALNWDVHDRERHSQVRQTLRTLDDGTLLVPIQQPAPDGFPTHLAMRLQVRDYDGRPVLRQPDDQVEPPLDTALDAVPELGPGQRLEAWPLTPTTLVGNLQALRLAAGQQYDLLVPVACILENPDNPVSRPYPPAPRPARVDFAAKSAGEVLAELMHTHDLHGGFRQSFVVLAAPTVRAAPHYTRFGHHDPGFRGAGGEPVGREIGNDLRRVEARSGGRLRSYAMADRAVVAWHGTTEPLLRAEGVCRAAYTAPIQELWHAWSLLVLEPIMFRELAGERSEEVARWLTAAASSGQPVAGTRVLSHMVLGAGSETTAEAVWRWSDTRTRMRLQAGLSRAGMIAGQFDFLVAGGQFGKQTERERLHSAVSMAPGGCQVLLQEIDGAVPWATVVTALHADAYGRPVWPVPVAERPDIGAIVAANPVRPVDRAELPPLLRWQGASAAETVAALAAASPLPLSLGTASIGSGYGRLDFGQFVPDRDGFGRPVPQWEAGRHTGPATTTADASIDAELRGATLTDALAVLCARTGLAYEVRDNAIVLGPNARNGRRDERTYRVSESAAATWLRLFPTSAAAVEFFGLGDGGQAALTDVGDALRVSGEARAVLRAGSLLADLDGPRFGPLSLVRDPGYRDLSLLPEARGYSAVARRFADGRLPARLLSLDAARLQPGDVLETPYERLQQTWEGQAAVTGWLRTAPSPPGEPRLAAVTVAGDAGLAMRLPPEQEALRHLARQKLHELAFDNQLIDAAVAQLAEATRTAGLPPPAGNVIRWRRGPETLPEDAALVDWQPRLTAAWGDVAVRTVLDELATTLECDWAVLPRSIVIGKRREMSLDYAGFDLPGEWLEDGDPAALWQTSGLHWSGADRWRYDADNERLHVCATPAFLTALERVLAGLHRQGWQVTLAGQVNGRDVATFRVYTVPGIVATVETPHWPPLHLELTPGTAPAANEAWLVHLAWKDSEGNEGQRNVHLQPGYPQEIELGDLAEDPSLRLVIEARPLNVSPRR